MQKFRSILFLSALAVAQQGLGQGDPAVIAKIIDEGKNRNQVMRHLDFLTHKIGARLTGSPNLEKACQWTMSKFREYGCKNVHMEPWGEVAVGFDRTTRQSAKMVAPYEIAFDFTSPSWSVGTKGAQRGLAVMEPATLEDLQKNTALLKGAWLICTGRSPRGELSDLQKAENAAGILGRVYGSRNDLVIPSGNMSTKWESIAAMLPVATIRKKDMDMVQYNFAKGRKVELEFDMGQRFIKGPRQVGNVVAEIPGTEKPDEVVIVSGHLDSWDGPAGQGALDNGTGTMVALEAARLLHVAGAKPKRTIRFIMWTGEEQGIFGSTDYVKKHAADLDKISCVFVDDGGTNYEGGLTCTEEMKPILEAAQAPMTGVFPDMPFEIKVVARIPRGGGSDHAPFNSAGVPGFFWFETGRSDYNFVHHTQHDRFEFAIPEYLVQSSTNSAVMAYGVANAVSLLPRKAGG